MQIRNELIPFDKTVNVIEINILIRKKNLKLIAFDKKICMSLLKRQFSITVLSPIMDALELGPLLIHSRKNGR